MIKSLLKFQVFPFFIALFLLCIYLFVLPDSEFEENRTVIKGEQSRFRGYVSNLNGTDQDRIDYFASISDSTQITIFGSSEFTASSYQPYHFIPDSFGIPVFGVGHAYHQCFSILLELLAFYDHIENQKICIILSPGWFGIGGTNPQAFTEFARIEFLNAILLNQEIPAAYKSWLGSRIIKQKESLNQLSPAMKMLSLESDDSSNWVSNVLFRKHLPALKTTNYEITTKVAKPKGTKVDFDRAEEQVKSLFESSVTNNSLWVYDDYYSKYVLDKEGKEKVGQLRPLEVSSDIEYQDFKKLLRLIKEKKMKAVFVIQGLNSLYYENIKSYDGLIDTLCQDLKMVGCPVLNLWNSDTADFERGVLKDVMHMGDRGWIKVNQFIAKSFQL